MSSINTANTDVQISSKDNFFRHYQQFGDLIKKVENLLVGRKNIQLEGNEINKSIVLLDTISKDLAGIISRSWGGTLVEKEEQTTKVLHRYARINGITAPYKDIYDALGKIYILDQQIADQGIIPLDTSIFQTPKTTARLMPNGSRNTREDVKVAGKYLMFSNVLQSLELVTLQDCMIYQESLEGEGRMRRVPYKIIYIPEPIMQTWCISDEIGQAIYVYRGYPLLETLVEMMKGGNEGQIQGIKLEWRKEEQEIENEMRKILNSGIQIGSGENIEPVPSADMKIQLWAQKSLMEARKYLDSIGMYYLGEGKWDLREMKGNGTWKDKIGGKGLASFPSTTWNKKWGIGNKKGGLLQSTDITKMLMSVGYKRGDIVFAEMLEDPLEWEESMDEEEYKIITQTELEKDEYKEFLDSIGMYYLGEGKWDLKEMKWAGTWKEKVGGKQLTSFPNQVWNKKWGVGNKNGMLQKGEDIAKMLVSVGYNVKDIELPEEDPLGWSENMNIDSYRIRARTELEKEEYREFFDSIGMHYLGERKWDLREMKGKGAWKEKVGGKGLKSFPSTAWNRKWGVGSRDATIKKSGICRKSGDIAKMLVSVGYKEENIEYIEGVEDSLELTEEMDEEEYKILVRTELEKEEYREFFDSIGMHYLGEGKWDLREMKGKGAWKERVGGKELTSFPSRVWNKKWGVGSKIGALQKSEDIAKMLISVGYKEEDIQRKKK